MRDVLPALAAVQAATRAGRHAVGVVGYAAAPAFDTALPARPDGALPLLAFALYDHAVALRVPAARARAAGVAPSAWEPDLGAGAYAGAVRAVRAHQLRGDCYQVNLTFGLRHPWSAAQDPYAAWLALCRAQGARYPLWLDWRTPGAGAAPGWALGCASPELFFERRGAEVLTRPMKGTAPRQPGAQADRAAARALWRSVKDRAENLMIVDMLRNDLGRVAVPGSVAVDRMWRLERYPTVWQLTSEVRARTHAGLAELFAALFPCASVTGAPKAAAMALIAQLERAPRGFYTGAAGVVEPGGDARFAVVIRSLTFDFRARRVHYGTGSAVVWDSSPAGEYAECRAKAAVLAAQPLRAGLMETLRWTPARGYLRAGAHRRRLRLSAAHLGQRVPAPSAVQACLDAAARHYPPRAQRVRLTLSPAGRLTVTHTDAPVRDGRVWRVALCPWPVDAGDWRLHHKTTRRALYARARRACPQADEVLLWNRAGQLTEGTITNVAVRLPGQAGWLTPALDCGLLPGVARGALLRRGRIREAVIRVDDLARCTHLVLFNSLRGLRRGVLQAALP